MPNIDHNEDQNLKDTPYTIDAEVDYDVLGSDESNEQTESTPEYDYDYFDEPTPEERPGHALLTIIIAVAIVAGLSWVPWNEIELTKGYFKNFGLFSDLFPSLKVFESNDYLDPEYEKLLGEGVNYDAVGVAPEHGTMSEVIEGQTDVKVEVPPLEVVDSIVIASRSTREGGVVVMEDYTASGNGLSRISHALSNASTRPVRIAIIGDSYIEGDIFAQDVRQLLQDNYGGRGVGYMYLQNDKIGGFRQSIGVNASGWEIHDIRKAGSSAYRTLPGEYFTGNGSTAYKGTGKLRHLDRWNTSKFLFVSPNSGTVTLTTDNGAVDYSVTGSNDVQCITVSGNTSSFNVKNKISGLTALGVWLGDDTGVTVDCMSLRGNSGISHRNLNADLAAQMRPYIDYDLIIIEYGINALESTRKNYDVYAKALLQVVASVRQSYPAADIILMGIGDRGQKQGSEMHSMTTAPNMVSAQRDVARRAQVVFWDTREAMGGEDAVISWRERKLVNPDYIHLNHNGGRELAEKFVEALRKAL